jgi:predicted kinase
MLAYDAAHAVARALLEHGQAAALECTYARFEQRLSMVKALADLPETAIWLVEFYVTPEEAVARFKQRDQETDLDEQLLRERVAAFPYSAQALRLVSSEAGPADLATEIEAWLKSEPAPVQTDVWVQEGRGWD